MDPSPLLRRAPHARRRSSGSDEDSSKLDSTSDGAADLISSEYQLLIDMGSGDRKGESKAAAEAFSGGKNKWKDEAKPLLESKQDYIHVRARRGQATDSHSLAERARREKISQRMKILQDLVPGCSKIIGKALVLDEIINYIQSLQHQVEFLSMKLEAVNSRDNYGVELFPSKDTYDTASGLAYSSHAKKECEQGLAPDWLHMQVGGTFERVS